RREDHVDTLLDTQLEVGVEGAWVAVEVLAGAELHRVHEDRHHHRCLGTDLLAGALDQRGVAGMQGTHRRHQPDRPLTPVECLPQLLATLREERGGGHGRSLRVGRAAGSGLASPTRTSASSSRLTMRAARMGNSRPSRTARSAVAFAMATYDGTV